MLFYLVFSPLSCTVFDGQLRRLVGGGWRSVTIFISRIANTNEQVNDPLCLDLAVTVELSALPGQ